VEAATKRQQQQRRKKETQPKEGENRHPRDGFARKYPPTCGDNRSGYQQ
jgi:hypothetical protein